MLRGQTAQMCKVIVDDFLHTVRPATMQFCIITAEVLRLKAFCAGAKITTGCRQSRRKSFSVLRQQQRTLLPERGSFASDKKLYHDCAERSFKWNSGGDFLCNFVPKSVWKVVCKLKTYYNRLYSRLWVTYWRSVRALLTRLALICTTDCTEWKY